MAYKASTWSDESLANVYLQLSRMEQSGFPTQQAFEILEKTDSKHRRNLRQLQQYLKAGKSVAEAGFKAGIFGVTDKTLLTAGESSGKVEHVYQQLATHYSNKSKRSRRIKSQLYLPAFVLVIALFVQPLPALILNEITGFDYLSATIGSIVKIALCLYIIIKVPSWLQFLGFTNFLSRLQLGLPFVASWLKTRQINSFLHTLGMLLSAGLPALEALPKAIDTIKNTVLREEFEPAIVTIDKGQSLTMALSIVKKIDSQTIGQILVGEQSGKLAETLINITKIETGRINLQEDMLAEWLPRIVYFIIVIWLAISLLDRNISSMIPL